MDEYRQKYGSFDNAKILNAQECEELQRSKNGSLFVNLNGTLVLRKLFDTAIRLAKTDLLVVGQEKTLKGEGSYYLLAEDDKWSRVYEYGLRYNS